MQPIPIPDEYLYADMKRITLGAVPGLEDAMRPLECGSVEGELGHEFWVLMELNDEDIERRKAWVVITGQLFQPIACANAVRNGELDGN